MRMVAGAVLALILMVLPAQAQRLVPQVAEGYELCVDTYGHLAGAPTPIHMLIAVGPRSGGTDEAACIWGGGQSARQAHDNAHKECKALYKYCLNFADSAGPYPAIRQINAAGGTLTPELYQQVRTALLRENRNSAGGTLSGGGGTAATPAPTKKGSGQSGGAAEPAANSGLADARTGLAYSAKGNLTHCLTGIFDLDIELSGFNRNSFYGSFETDNNLIFRNGCNQMLTAWICYTDSWQVYTCKYSPDVAPGEQTSNFSPIVGDRFFYLACPNGKNACNTAGHNWYNKSQGQPRGTDLRSIR